MSAAVATPLAPVASTSRSRSRPPRGAVGLGTFPEDGPSSSRTLIESLARSLSRPRRSPSRSPPLQPAPALPVAQTREDFIAAHGGHPWGALGMGTPANASASTATSSRSTSRGRQTSAAPPPPRREWSTSRREWIEAGSTSAASAIDALVGSSSSSRSTPSSSRSQSPVRGRSAAVVAEQDVSTSRSRSRSVLERVRGMMSPRSSSRGGVDLPAAANATVEEEEEEKQPIVPK
ncbi:hypothetical protein JCM10908_002661 [Rhodotorula pacifica]|uniref:uncharacterized protein n=1 Tax=Rhodotorula pacifica TaxID=1495444 RepID=UPI00316B9E45